MGEERMRVNRKGPNWHPIYLVLFSKLTPITGELFTLKSWLRLGKHRQSRVHKTYCFPRSQSISVKYTCHNH